MSRFGECDDWDNETILAAGRWTARFNAVLRGKPAQPFFRELEAALLAMSDKRLIEGALVRDGQVCALGQLLAHRKEQSGMSRKQALAAIEREFPWGDSELDIATDAARITGMSVTFGELIQWMNDEDAGSGLTPERRWQAMLDWTQAQIRPLAAAMHGFQPERRED